MKRFSFLPLAAATMLCCGLAFAQPAAPEPAEEFDGFDRPGMHEMMAEKLGLSAEQKEQIRKITLDARKKNIEVEAKGKVARIELHELMAADAPDQHKINAKITELSQTHETLLRSRVETMLAVKKILTPEQRAKMKELRPFGPGMHGRMGKPGQGQGMMGPRHMGPRHGAPRGEQQ